MLNTQNPANSWSTCATRILYVYFSWFKPSHLFCLDFLQPSHWFSHDFKRHLHPWLRQGPQLKACGWTLAAQLQVHLDWSKKFNGFFFAQQLAKGWRSSNTLRFDPSPPKKWERGVISANKQKYHHHTPHSPKPETVPKAVPRRFLLEKRLQKRQKAKDGWDPTTISTWVTLTGLDQEGIPSVLSASMSTRKTRRMSMMSTPSNFIHKSYVCAQSKQSKQIEHVFKPWKLEVVTYLDGVFCPYICTSNGISLLLPRFFDKCGICHIFDGLQLVSYINERKTDWERILGEASQNPVVQLFKKLYVMAYKKIQFLSICSLRHHLSTIVYV